MCKKWWLSFVLIVTVVTANAQFRKIPAVVTDAFKAKYASASHVEWKDKFSNFQAEFTLGENQLKSTFSSKGEWLKTESKYNFSSLPEEVKDGFKKSKYADLTVADVIQVEEKDKQVQYKMVVKKGDFNKKNLVFSTAGQLLSDKGTL